MLTALALENWRYRLFHYAPSVLALSPAQGHDIAQAFLQWAEAKQLSMGWSMHVHLLNWLCQEEKWREHIQADRVKELLRAAVTRWSLSGLDHFDAQGIMVTVKQLPELAIGLWKSSAADQFSKLVTIQLADAVRPQADSYALAYQQGRWETQWLALPL